jgi:hypothetical protein
MMEQLKLNAKQYDKARLNEMKDKDIEKTKDKLRRDEEKYLKMKMDKEEYKKYIASLQKELTVKKH